MSKRAAPTTTEEMPDTAELEATFRQIMDSIVAKPGYDKSLGPGLPPDITDVIFDRQILVDVILKTTITDRSYRLLSLIFRSKLDALNPAAIHYEFMAALLSVLWQDNISSNPAIIVETYRSLLKFLNLHIPKPKDSSLGKLDTISAKTAEAYLKKSACVAPIVVPCPLTDIVDLLIEIFKIVHTLETAARIRFSGLHVQNPIVTKKNPDPTTKITVNFDRPALVSYSVQKTENGTKNMIFYKVDDKSCIFDEIKNYPCVRADGYEDMFRDGSVFWADIGVSEMKELKKHSVMPMPGMSTCKRFAIIKSIVLVKTPWMDDASIENFRPKFNSRAYTTTAVEIHMQLEQFDKFITTTNIENA